MPRDVVVNGRFLARRLTGVERYGREILARIGDRCRLEKTTLQGVRGHLWEQLTLPGAVHRNSILWSPANTGPLMISKQALTIHDLSPLEHPEWFRQAFAVWYRLFLPILVRRVRVVFTPSEHVKRKIRARFKLENVTVTPNGVDPHRFHPGARQHKYDLPSRYILCLGTLEPRKNLVGLLQAWDTVRKDLKDVWLILGGADGAVFRSLQVSQQIERVRWLGYVEEDQLPGLYAGATLFVLPSFEEGFGLPALEAMACGTPTIVSSTGALCEVVGDAAYIFDLHQPCSLPDAILTCLASDSLQASLREKGLRRGRCFAWEHTAELIWKTLNEI